jgi:hypothetical protein
MLGILGSINDLRVVQSSLTDLNRQLVNASDTNTWGLVCSRVLGSSVPVDLWQLLFRKPFCLRIKSLLSETFLDTRHSIENMVSDKIARIERSQVPGEHAQFSHAESLNVDQTSVSALAIEAAQFLRANFEVVSTDVQVLVSQPGTDALNAEDSEVVAAIREHCVVMTIWVIAGLRQKCASVQTQTSQTECRAQGGALNPKVVTEQLLLLGQVCWALASDEALLSMVSMGAKTPAPSEAELRAAFKTVDSTGRGEIGAVQVVEAQVGDVS